MTRLVARLAACGVATTVGVLLSPFWLCSAASAVIFVDMLGRARRSYR